MSISLSRKALAESILQLDGDDFSLGDYPFYDALYTGEYSRSILMCGRQVGKSVSAAAFTVCEAVAVPHFKTLYISPTQKQTSTFSNTRISKLIQHSPDLRSMMGRVLSDNVFLKVLGNGSELIFNYASDDADRVRGISADRVIYDEVQDIDYQSVVPVINECLANSRFGYVSYMGTPKTMENTIQFIWEQSTQSEWCIRCSSCGKRSFYRSSRGITDKGLACLSCGALVDVRDGTWVDMAPKAKTQGFHIPQVILPQNQAPHRWERITHKLETYPESKFNNEVMGVSDSVGSRLIGVDDLAACCSDSPLPAAGFTCGGVDWSGGGTSGVSRTVAWVFSNSPGGTFNTVDYKVFPNQNPVSTVDELATFFSRYRVNLVIGDAGEGALANSLLLSKLQCPLYQLQYGSQTKPLKWNGIDRYTADRTTLIDCFFYDIKKKRIAFLGEPRMSEAFEDFLALYEEVTPAGKKVWRHSPSKPDDCLHAAVFSWVACKVLTHDMTFY
jgi:hypothetical protein